MYFLNLEQVNIPHYIFKIIKGISNSFFQALKLRHPFKKNYHNSHTFLGSSTEHHILILIQYFTDIN